MVQLVTVRTLNEATQPRRLVRVRPHSTGGWSLVRVVQGCTHWHHQGRGQLLQPSGASTGKYLPLTTAPHNTYHHCSVSGDTEIFINGVRMAYNVISAHPMQWTILPIYSIYIISYL